MGWIIDYVKMRFFERLQSLNGTMDFSHSLLANVYLIKRQYDNESDKENLMDALRKAGLLN